MAQAHLVVGGTVEYTAGGKGNYDTLRAAISFPDNNRPIMQRCIGVKGLQNKFRSNTGIQLNAGKDILFEIVDTLQDDERSMVFCG